MTATIAEEILKPKSGEKSDMKKSRRQHRSSSSPLAPPNDAEDYLGRVGSATKSDKDVKMRSSKSSHLSHRFLSTDLQHMKDELYKLRCSTAVIHDIDSRFELEWFNSATQTRRMKLHTIRANYHARAALLLNQ
uniref:Replication factor C subunit 1 n=1 Tax=Lygus hesperus TaxID=30085 RepID=A0A0A9ZCT4_LYGHE